MKRKRKNKRKPIGTKPSGDVQFYKGGGGGAAAQRDVIHEPEGIDTPNFPRPTDPELQGKPPGGVSLSRVEVLDALSEGPIDGLASGDYVTSGYASETGYRKVNFKPYVAGTVSQVKSGWARSVNYNGVPVMNKAGLRNFQNVDVGFSRGELVGENLVLDSNSDDQLQIARAIGERLRGPELEYQDTNYAADHMKLKAKQDPQGRSEGLPKLYYIRNKRCNGFTVVVRVASLMENLMTGSTEEGAKVGKGDVKATSVTYRIDYRPYFSDDTKNKDFFTFDDDDITAANPAGITHDTSNVKSEIIHGRISDGYARSTTFHISDSDREYMDDASFIGWRIAVYRETFDSFRGALRNQTFVDSITELYEEKFCYPATAFVRHRFRADTFKAIPARVHDIRGLQVKIPNNYNPIMRTYGQERGGAEGGSPPRGTVDGGDPYLDTMYGIGDDGETPVSLGPAEQSWNGGWKRNSDGTLKKEWTDNPAWIYYDIITNKRYGLGKWIDEARVDKWAMFNIAQYCDEMVPNGSKADENDDIPGADFGEPRFSANIYISNQEDAFSVINNFASIFRGLTFYSAGKLQATFDSPKDPVYLFNNSNVSNGNFVYSSSAKKARHSVCLVRYNDKENDYKPSIEYVEDIDSIKKYGIRVKDLTAFGTTSKTQAQRWGQWTLATERMETETCNFTAGVEAVYLQAGDVVAVSDEYRGTYENVLSRRRGGRCFSFESKSGANMDGVANWTGRVILDRSISGWLDGGSAYNLEDANPELYFSIVTPPAYGDPLTTDLGTSDLADLYNRKSAIQSLRFQKSDAGVGSIPSHETGKYDSDIEADGTKSIGERTIIEFTGLYHEGLNVIDVENYNVTGFTGVLYDENGDIVLNNGNVSGYVENSPDSFVWCVEYTGAKLDYKPDKELWKIIGLEEKANFKYSIQTVKHDIHKFDFVDKQYEPLVQETAGFPDPPQNLDLSNVQDIDGLTAKKVTYTWNSPGGAQPSTVDNLNGYRIYIKRGSDFNSTDDFTEDLYNVHPNGRYYSRFIPAEGTVEEAIFIPFVNDTYYFRIYSVNKFGRSLHKDSNANGSVAVNGINLIEDLTVSSLSLAGVTDMTSFTQRTSQVHLYELGDNDPGTKDGWPYYNLANANLDWQCGFRGDPDVLQGLNMPSDYTFRMTFRKPVSRTSDVPESDLNMILLEVTGQSPFDLNYTLKIEDNIAIDLPAAYDYPEMYGDTVTPLRGLDVIVEAIDTEGNSSAGGSVIYNGAGELTQDSTYTNNNGYDILYIENTPASGVRLTHRLSEGGTASENCDSAACNEYCTDQWLNADGTLNFILKRDIPGRVTGQADMTNAVFLISRNHFTTADIPNMLQQYVISDSNPAGHTQLVSPMNFDDGAGDTHLIMGQGWMSQTDSSLTVPTPFQNVMSESTEDEAGAFTHLYMAVGMVDHFLERAVASNPGKRELVKKIMWGDEFSDNVVKIGARNAFLAGSLSWRAWCVLNVNWDCQTDLNFHRGGFDTVELEDYAGNYYIRRAWSTGGKSPQTKYNFTTIQAMRRARKFIFSEPQPSNQYEVIVMFSPTAKWGTGPGGTTDKPHGTELPIYGDSSLGTPQLEMLCANKTKESFTIQDMSLGGFGQGNNPLRGNLFVGVLLGEPWPDDGSNVGGFGQKTSDVLFDYLFDGWGTSTTTDIDTYNLN